MIKKLKVFHKRHRLGTNKIKPVTTNRG